MVPYNRKSFLQGSNVIQTSINQYRRPSLSGNVNTVRWNPRGDTLASCSDDSLVLLWMKREGCDPSAGRPSLVRQSL